MLYSKKKREKKKINLKIKYGLINKSIICEKRKVKLLLKNFKDKNTTLFLTL